MLQCTIVANTWPTTSIVLISLTDDLFGHLYFLCYHVHVQLCACIAQRPHSCHDMAVHTCCLATPHNHRDAIVHILLPKAIISLQCLIDVNHGQQMPLQWHYYNNYKQQRLQSPQVATLLQSSHAVALRNHYNRHRVAPMVLSYASTAHDWIGNHRRSSPSTILLLIASC